MGTAGVIRSHPYGHVPLKITGTVEGQVSDLRKILEWRSYPHIEGEAQKCGRPVEWVEGMEVRIQWNKVSQMTGELLQTSWGLNTF